MKSGIKEPIVQQKQNGAGLEESAQNQVEK